MGAGSMRTPCIVSLAAHDQLYRELTRPLRATMLARGGPEIMTSNDLDAFFDGWNRHDVDALMRFMADDCVFETSSGPQACGTRHAGRERVREAFGRVFALYPDAAFADTRHVIAGNRGLSEWLFTGTAADGKKVEVNGCDVFTFDGDKIAVKSSYFKNRTS
jgi:ketosteroid isomerase-like protein